MCIFVGYLFGKKGWKLYDLEKDEFLVSRDVVFDETNFPFSEKKEVEFRIMPQIDLGVYDEIQQPEIMIDKGRSDVSPGVGVEQVAENRGGECPRRRSASRDRGGRTWSS